MFKLKRSAAEAIGDVLPISEQTYREITPTRDVTGPSFAESQIAFKFHVNGESWWHPKTSYLRMRLRLYKLDNDMKTELPLELKDGIAPSANICANLFRSCEFGINDKPVSSINNFVSQVDALQNRLCKDKELLNTVIRSTSLVDMSFNDRLNMVSTDGKSNLPATTFRYTDFNSIENGYPSDTPLFENMGTTIEINSADTQINIGFGQIQSAQEQADISRVFLGNDVRIRTLTRDFKFTVFRVIWNHSANVTLFYESSGHFLDVPFNIPITANPCNFFIDVKHPHVAKKDFEVCWQPPLSVFGLDTALPSGDYYLLLQPQPATMLLSMAVQCAGNSSALINANKLRFEVEHCALFLHNIEGTRNPDGPYYLDLDQCRMQTTELTTSSYSQKTFDVSPSVRALTIAYQDNRVESSDECLRLKPDLFKVGERLELSLNRLLVDYATQQKPQPDGQPEYTVSKHRDYTTQLYYNSLIQAGQAWNIGGSETLEEWQAKGPYYHFEWERDGQDRSQRVRVYNGFDTSRGSIHIHGRILLFEHIKSVVTVMMQDGKVRDVQVEEV
jgi:hypothetical protein